MYSESIQLPAKKHYNVTDRFRSRLFSIHLLKFKRSKLFFSLKQQTAICSFVSDFKFNFCREHLKIIIYLHSMLLTDFLPD